jgi:hypothetical protein
MMSGAAEVKAQIQAIGLPGEGIALLSAHDADFGQALDKVSPGLRSRADFAPHVAQSVMIVNRSSHAIAGYALQWQITTRQGNVLTHNQEFLEPPAFDVGHRLHYGILPHTLVLVTPYFAWNETMLKGLEKATSTTKIPDEGLSQKLENAASVSVSLDGVFYEDGEFVGADHSLFFEHTRHQLEAQRQIAEFLSRALSEGQSPESLATALTAKVNAGADINAMTTDDREMATLYDSHEAETFLQYVRMKRMDIVSANVSRRLSEQHIAVFRR